MPAFDPRAYEDQVLKPMRRLLPNLPDDLLTRYAVDPAMDAAALRERVDSVVRLWNKLGLRPGHSGMVAKQLIHEHHELEKAGNDLAAPQFWRTWVTRRQQEVGTAIDALAAQLKADNGALGVVTAAQLRHAAALHGGLDQASVDRARQKAGLALVEPVELPTAPGTRTQARVLNDALLAAGAASIPELLFPTLTSFALLGGLQVTPRPEGRTVALTQKAAEERMHELDRMPDSPRVRAVRQAVGILVTEGKVGVDLDTVALFHLLQPVRESQADGAGAGTLFSQLTRAKLERADAARLIVSLLVQGTPRRDPAAEVADLLAEGRLVAAQQAAAGLPGPDGDAARAGVARQRARVDELRTTAADAVRAGDDERAAAALSEALSLAGDLPGLAAELAAVPTAPVLAATAVPDGGGVRITWRPAAEHDERTAVRVVRGIGRPPGDPEDGTAVAVQGGHAADPEPPVGARAHYAVFAQIEGRRWSRPTATAVEVVPPVTDFVVEGAKGVVMGRWRAHPAVAAVEVRRSTGSPDAPGEPVPVQHNKGFRDEGVADGVQYFYSVVAVYPAAGGGVLRSVAATGRGTTRLDAKAVASLNATAVPGIAPRVRLTWRQQPGNEIVLRRAGRACPWEYGARVASADVGGWGEELGGELVTRGSSASLLAPIPAGRSWIVAFTRSPDGWLRGQDAYLELIDPVRRVRAQRFGDDVRVTWQWPDDISAAEVTWAGGQRLITQQQFRDEGGCQLRGVPGVRRVDVAAVILGRAEEGRSSAVSVDVEERPVRISYQLRRRGHRLAGGVRCTVTVSSPGPLSRGVLVLIASPGPVMPQSPAPRPAAGTVELLRAEVDLDAGISLTLPEVTLPGTLRKPYWLRCFLIEPAAAVLVDPPVSQLKVS